MTELEYNEFKRRYDKFKKNNLPTPFWDEERQTFEYVYYSEETFIKSKKKEKTLNVNKSLTDALGDISLVSFYYPFTSKYIVSHRENKKCVFKTIIGHTHAHSFEDVVRHLYASPESFNISKDEEQFYSNQELDYLRRVQKYLLFIGMKDLENKKIPVSRYRNKIHFKYEKAFVYRFNDEILNNILNGKINFKVTKWYSEYDGDKKYKPKEYQALIIDKNNDFKIFVEFTKREIKKYSDIKDIYKKDNLKDDDKVIVNYFKILEMF